MASLEVLALQTGSGKTHTLIGDIHSEPQRGVAPRAAAEVFRAMSAMQSSGERSFLVEVSAVEIYCERIRDLLSFSEASHNLSVQQLSGPFGLCAP